MAPTQSQRVGASFMPGAPSRAELLNENQRRHLVASLASVERALRQIVLLAEARPATTPAAPGRELYDLPPTFGNSIRYPITADCRASLSEGLTRLDARRRPRRRPGDGSGREWPDCMESGEGADAVWVSHFPALSQSESRPYILSHGHQTEALKQEAGSASSGRRREAAAARHQHARHRRTGPTLRTACPDGPAG